MEIPDSFKIFDIEYKIVYDKFLYMNTGYYGNVDYLNHIITIQDPEVGFFSEKFLEKIFCHELFHVILNEISELDLRDNEDFVIVMGNALQQIINSFEFKKKDK